MNERNFELHAEETHNKLQVIQSSLDNLVTVLSKAAGADISGISDEPPKVEIVGGVSVNTQESVEITNLQEIHDAVKMLADETRKTIIETYKAPPDKITVKNIAEAKADTVKVNNMVEFSNTVITALKPIIDEIAKIEPKVKVEQQNIVFPRSAKEAIPVRLSDGKSFYNAIFTSISNGFNSDGIISAIGDINGTTKYITRIDEASATITYIGKAVPAGTAVPTSDPLWQITKIDETSGTVITYADGDLLFDNVFDDRAGLTYA
jgi:hypothetical protein